MATTIQIKRGTGSAVPSGLADGELAINLDNGKLFFGSGSTSINSFRFENLTAENYIVSSSVTNITTQELSGSTNFGDTADDTHTFTGAITASGDISSSGDIIGQNFTAHDVLSTSFTGSVDDPAIRLGPLSGNLSGNKVGIMLEDAVPNNKLFVPFFVSNGSKVFGFGTNMEMHKSIQMNEYKISFDGDATNTFIHADSATPENLEIHADGNRELRAQDDLQVYSDVDITGEITASGNISSSGNIYAEDFWDNGVNIKDIYANQNVTGSYALTSSLQELIDVTGSYAITGSDVIFNHVTASGNISASGDIKALTFTSPTLDVTGGSAQITADKPLTFGTLVSGDTGRLNIKHDDSEGTIANAVGVLTISNTGVGGIKLGASATQHITASSNISSSGTVIANAFEGTTISANRRTFTVTADTAGLHDGDVVYFGGTTSMTTGAIYHYKSDGTWELADADAVATSDGLLGVALGAASDTNGVLLRGIVTLDHDAGAIGDVLYISTTAGDCTATAPSGTNDVVRIIGYKIFHATQKQVWFNPSSDFIIHA